MTRHPVVSDLAHAVGGRLAPNGREHPAQGGVVDLLARHPVAEGARGGGTGLGLASAVRHAPAVCTETLSRVNTLSVSALNERIKSETIEAMDLDEIARAWVRKLLETETQRSLAKRFGMKEPGMSLLKEEEQPEGDTRYVSLSYLDAYAKSFDPPKSLGEVMQSLTDWVKLQEATGVSMVETEIEGTRVVLSSRVAPPVPGSAGDRPRSGATGGPKRAPAAGSTPPRRRRHR